MNNPEIFNNPEVYARAAEAAKRNQEAKDKILENKFQELQVARSKVFSIIFDHSIYGAVTKTCYHPNEVIAFLKTIDFEIVSNVNIQYS